MSQGTLVAVLSNPPTTSGARTRARVELLARLLSFDQVHIGNLFAGATRSFDELGQVAAEEGGWLAARDELSELLVSAGGVLLAWGTRPPSGAAGVWQRDQVAWLQSQLHDLGVSAVTIGDGPRHPSRWQRWTAAHHPGVHFEDALLMSCQGSEPTVDLPQDRASV